MFQKLLHWSLFKAIAIAVLVAFVSLIPVETGYAQTIMPQPGDMVHITGAFTPTLMRGLRVDLKDPFNLYFVMSNGEKTFAQGEQKEEYQKLIKYFMASLITPKRDMWVNLSPKEADRIIPDNFSLTAMGRDLLAQDYLLKQFTASLIAPDTRLGKKFWDEVYQKARALYGSTDIPVNTFNKVWIIADKADIYQKDDTALLVGSHLKVMLEQDFMAVEANKAQFGGASDTQGQAAGDLASDIARQVIVPVIEKEVNEGANFAEVRQVYNSMILATWFKKVLKDSLLGQVYADQSKVAGIEVNDPGAKERIYRQYLQAYKTGVFNYIKDELDPVSQEMLPRKYFSGGMESIDEAQINTDVPAEKAKEAFARQKHNVISVILRTSDGAQVVPEKKTPVSVAAPVAKPSWSNKLARVNVALKQAYQQYTAAAKRLVTRQRPGVPLAARLKKNMNVLFLALSLNSSFMSAMPASLLANPAEKPTVTQNTQVQAPVAPSLKVVGSRTERFDGTTATAALSADFEEVTKDHPLLGHTIKVGDHFETIEVGMRLKMGDVADLKNGVPEGVYPTKEGKVVVAIFRDGKAAPVNVQEKEKSPGQKVAPAQEAGSTVGGTQTVVQEKRAAYQLTLLKEMLKNKKMIDSLAQVGRGIDKMKARLYADSLKQRTAQDAGVALGKKAFDPKYGFRERERTTEATTLEAQSQVNVMVETSNYQRMGTFKSISLGAGVHANIGPVIPFGQQLEMKGIIAAGNMSVMSILYIGDNVLQEIDGMRLRPTNEQSWLIQGHKSFLGKMLGALTIDRPLVYGANNTNYELQANRITRIGLPRTIGQVFGLAARLPVAGKIFGPEGELPLSGGYHYKYGAREISFYKSAYLNNDENKIFMVVERQFPADRDELMKLANDKTFNMFNPDDVERYLKFAQEGGGYARGLIIDKTTGEIQYAFISPRDPKGYTPDRVVLVSSNERYKQMMVKETMVQSGVDEQGRKIVAYTRNRLTGEILAMYTAENFPTPNDAEKEDFNKPVLEYTRWAAEVNYWLYHEKKGPEAVEVPYTDENGHTKSVMVTPPPDEKMPIGMVLYGLTGRIYFAGEENAFRVAAGKVTAQSVTYGKNYTDPVEAAWGGVLDPETGEVRLVTEMPVLVEKTMPAIPGVGAPAPKNAVSEKSQPDMIAADVRAVEEAVEAPADTTLSAAVRSDIKKPAEVQKEKKILPDQPDLGPKAEHHGILINRAGNELNNNQYGLLFGRLKDEVDQPLANLWINRQKVPDYMAQDAYAKTDIRHVPSYIDWLMKHLDRHKEFEGVALDAQPAYTAWVTRSGARFIPGKRFNDTVNKGMQGVGVIYYMDGRMPAVAGSSRDFVSLGRALKLGIAKNVRAGEKNMVVVSLPDGEIAMSPKAMVKVENGRVAGVFTAGITTLKQRNEQLRVLRHGGIEAENLATGEFEIYARSNALSGAQRAAGILPERDFVALVAANRIDMVPVEGGAKGDKRVVILKLPRPRVAKGIPAAVKELTLKEFYARNFLVVWKGPKGKEMSQFVPRSALERNAGVLATDAKDIIQFDADGNEAARALRTRAGYQVIAMSEMQGFLNNNFLAVAPGYKTAMFVPFTALVQPGTREEIRLSAIEFQLIDVKGNQTGRLYLSKNPLASRLEKFGPNGTSLIYAVFDWDKKKEEGKADDGIYQLSRDGKPIGQTVSLSKEQIALLDPEMAKGEKAIIKSDYQTHVSTIEIFATLKDSTPVRVIDPLAQSVTYNDGKGRFLYKARMDQDHWNKVRPFMEKFSQGKSFVSTYSAAIDTKYRGIDIPLDGRMVKGLLVFNRITEQDGKVVVDYIDVTGSHPGAYAMTGRMIFDTEGNKKVHYTGNILLPKEIKNGNDLLAKVDEDGFSKQEVYSYEEGPVGGFKERAVYERRDKGWVFVRRINQTCEAEIGKNGIDYDRFMAVPEVSTLMHAAGVDARKAVLRYTSVVTSEGVEIVDYIKQFDALDKKVFTVYKYKGQIFKIVVTTAHDPLTGEVVGSFTLNKNYERNEQQAYLDDKELSDLKMSSLAGDIFNPAVVADYKQTTGEDLWKGLAIEGITPDTKLVVVRSKERLTSVDGKYSEQWSLPEYKVMRPHDNTGRSLATISGNGSIAITPWWDHRSLGTLTAQKPFKDSVIPSPNIIPRSVRLHYTHKEHEMIVYDRPENNVTLGARYEAKVAEFLKNITYDVLTGRKVREEFKQDLSLIAQLVNKATERVFGWEFFSDSKTLNYDLKSNANTPVNAVDGKGNEIARWKSVSFDEKGSQTQIIKEQHSLLKFWWPTMARHYDGYGEGWQLDAKVTQFRLLLMAILAIIAFPVTVVLRAFQSSAKRKKAAAKVRAMPTGELYDEDIAIAAQQRFAAKVAPSVQESEYRFKMTGNAEALFLFNLNVIYTLGISRYIKAHGIKPEDYKSVVDTDALKAWDEYMASAGQYLAQELARSATTIVWDKVVQDANSSVMGIAMESAKASAAVSEKPVKAAEVVDDLVKLKAALTGSSVFVAEEFENTLIQANQLIDEISKAAGKTGQTQSSMAAAVKWLNESTEPFEIYFKLKEAGILTDEQVSLVENYINTFNDKSIRLVKEGFLEFFAGEFDNDLTKANALIEAISKTTGKAGQAQSSMEAAVKWLNESTEPFEIFFKLNGEGGLSDAQVKVVEDHIKTLSNASIKFIEEGNWKALAGTFEGQELKRIILKTLYSDQVPQNLKVKDWKKFTGTLDGYGLRRVILKTLYPNLTPGRKISEGIKDKTLAELLAKQEVLDIVQKMAGVYRIYREQEEKAVKKYDIANTPIDRETHFALKQIRAKFLQGKIAPLKQELEAVIAASVKTANWGDDKLVGIQTGSGLKMKDENDQTTDQYTQVGKADQQIWDKLEAYFATYRDLLSEAMDADSKAAEASKDKFDDIMKELGITTTGKSKFSYEHFQGFLKENNFDPAPNRVIRNNKGEDVYVADAGVLLGELKQGNLSRQDIDGYIKSLNKLTFKTFLGLGIKAIHPLLLDGTVMPRMVLAGVGLAMLTLGSVSLGAWFATPILGIAAWKLLAGIGVALGVGAVADYFKISHSEHMSTPVRLGLAVAAVAGAAVVAALPTVGVGILFLKASLGLPLLIEALSLTLWQRSSLGLSLYYHYRASSTPGRLRANFFIWAQYFSFMAISLFFGWVTYGFFASQLLLGAMPVLAGALLLFGLTAYLTNFGLWMGIGFVASLPLPWFRKEGAAAPSDLAREWAGLKKEERLLINYVGPVLGSIGLMKEHVQRPANTDDAVANFIKELQAHIVNNSPEVLGALADIRQRAGIRSDRTTEDFIEKDLQKWIKLLYQKEAEAKTVFMEDKQLLAKGTRRTQAKVPANRIIVYDTPEQRDQLILARDINKLVMPVTGVVENFIKELQWLVADDSPAALGTLEGIRKKLGVPADKPMAQFVDEDVRAWMARLYSKEAASGVSLMSDDQLLARGTPRAPGEIPLDLSIIYDTPQEREQLIFAKELNQLMSLFNPIGEKGGLNPYDAGVSLVGLAHMLRDTLDPEGVPLGKKTIFAFTYNNTTEKNQATIEKFVRLFGHISGAEVSMNFVPTVVFMKSGTMNGDRSLSRDYEVGRERARKLSQVRRILILDRNANALDLRRHINDLVASMNNPEQVIMVAHRNTTNTRRYIGVQNYLVEFGQGNSMMGFNEKIGTGWESNMGIYGWDALMKLSNPNFPRKGFTPDTRKANKARSQEAGLGAEYADQFGMIGFAPNAVGISEDYWAVLQQAHMLVALGYDPSYAISTSIHHKRRETFSNFELGSAVPRWAGGRNQSIGSFMNQTINDIGPEAYVEREANRNVGRHYVGMPLGLLNLILLPLSVVFGFNPFQGLWLWLVGFGTVFNQILRLHGWGAMMDDSGVLFGTARFFFYQCRDMSVFAIRVMLETLSMINSYGGLTFVFNVSGGGGVAHDTNVWTQLKANPLSFVSFKSVVGIGALTTALMLVSTVCGLTIAHVTMMFLAMFWGVNMLIGLFVSENQPGVKVWHGKGDNLAASLGGLSAVAFAVLVYAQKWAIFALGPYAIAMFILYKVVAHHPEMKRLVSQFNRYFVRTSGAALLFALVPAGLFVKFNIWPNVTAVFTITEFFTGLGIFLGGILGVIGLGYGVGSLAERRVKKEYEATVARFWKERDSLNDATRMIVGQRIHQVNIYRDQMAYKRASGALKEINAELDGKVSVPAVPLMGSGPSAMKKPGASVENKAAADEALAAEKRKVGWLRGKWASLQILEKHLKARVAAATMLKNASLAGQNSSDKGQVADNVGGINLNDEHLTITIKVDGAGIPLPVRFQDPAMVNIQGLSPVIRDISPVTSANMPVLAELLK